MYRVWTKNWNGTYHIMNGWSTRAECKRLIIGRWRHWPPWAFISKARNTVSFIRYNGR